MDARALNIGIDGDRLCGPGRGIDRFLGVLIAGLASASHPNRIAIYMQDPNSLPRALEDLPLPVMRKNLGFRMHYIPHTGWATRPFLRDLDLYHFPGPDTWYSRRCASLVTVHDAAHYRYPERFFSTSREEERFHSHMRRIREYANHVSTVSHFAARELQTYGCVAEDCLSVITNGIGPAHEPTEEMRRRVRKQHKVSAGFMLFVGGNDFRKNLRGVVEALSILVAKGGWTKPLLVVGRKGEGPQYDRIEDLPGYDKLEKDGMFRWMGRISNADLDSLYGAADLLIFPSLYEGFGYPPLEAAQRGTPVVVSRQGAIEEVMGDAAYYASDTSGEAIADAIREILANPSRLEKLRKLGLRRAARYTEEAMAKSYLDLYHRVAHELKAGA